MIPTRILPRSSIFFPALICCLLTPGTSRADDILVNGSSRIDYRYDQDSGVSGVNAWFDAWAFYRNWEGSARLRINQAIGDADGEDFQEIDRRHLAFVTSDLDITAGNYYDTFGNGIVLRTLEQRFVTLSRVDRAFNLDRNLDGVRVRGELGPIRLTALSGAPNVQELSGPGGVTRFDRDDLIQGTEVVGNLWQHLDLAWAYVLYESPSPSDPDLREQEDLTSYWARGIWRGLSGSFEYAEKRHRPESPRGFARYGGVQAAVGGLGTSLEFKSYRNFLFPYHELPSLVRTHDTVLLNRATHVVLPDDERGFQLETLFSPNLDTALLFNLSASNGSDDNPDRKFTEVFLQGRHEIEAFGAGRLALDWARDQTKFPEVRKQWTAALELEKFFSGGHSGILDIDVQAVETTLSEYTNQLAQLIYSRAGRVTVAAIAEHTTNPLEKQQQQQEHFSGSLDVRVSGHHDLTVWYGSRPAGIICSGGFCFFSEAFEGLEVRLLSSF